MSRESQLPTRWTHTSLIFFPPFVDISTAAQFSRLIFAYPQPSITMIFLAGSERRPTTLLLLLAAWWKWIKNIMFNSTIWHVFLSSSCCSFSASIPALTLFPPISVKAPKNWTNNFTKISFVAWSILCLCCASMLCTSSPIERERGELMNEFLRILSRTLFFHPKKTNKN